jgi:hypothetical protein
VKPSREWAGSAPAVSRNIWGKNDPGMKHDLSGAHPELAARAKSEFQKLSKETK